MEKLGWANYWLYSHLFWLVSVFFLPPFYFLLTWPLQVSSSIFHPFSSFLFPFHFSSFFFFYFPFQPNLRFSFLWSLCLFLYNLRCYVFDYIGLFLQKCSFLIAPLGGPIPGCGDINLGNQYTPIMSDYVC